jgi:hypothetical protein
VVADGSGCALIAGTGDDRIRVVSSGRPPRGSLTAGDVIAGS